MADASTIGLISADSHVNEPRDLWLKNLPARLRDQAMGGLEASDDGGWKLVLEGRHVGKSGESEEARLAVLEPAHRLEVMRKEGVIGECVFPTIGLHVWMLADADAGQYSCRIYNEWIADQLQGRSPRFACAGLVPTWRVEDAVAEVEFIASIGLRAVMLPIAPARELTQQSAVSWPNWNHSNWEPLWRTIEEAGLPIVMHQGTGHDMVWYRGPGAVLANLISTQAMAPRTAALLATSGVLAEHPDLHFVFVECNGGWLSWIMETVDYYAEAFARYDEDVVGKNKLYPALPEKPSFYVKRQIHATFQDDETCLLCLPKSGADCLLWGGDYPHEEGTYPHTRATVDRLSLSLDAAHTAQIFRDNAISLFKFDPGIVSRPIEDELRIQ